MNFKPKTENELATLTDEELVAFAVAARDSNRPDQFDLAVAIFVIGREPMVRAMVGGKVPPVAVDDVVQDVLVSALESLSSIEGIATGQFVNWLKTIAFFRIADFHKKAEKTPGFEPIDGGGDDDDERIIELVGIGGDRTGEVEVRIVFQEVLASFSEVHQRVVWLRIEGFPSIEVAEIINEEVASGEIDSEDGKKMTSANVDQIYSRFRKKLKKALGLEEVK